MSKQPSMASEKAISRRRPLQTCASSISGVISTAYRRSPQLNGPLGNFTEHLTTFATSSFPFASRMKDLGKTIISLTDDHILFHERIAEFVFPPSGLVFDKIDEVVRSIEEFPHRFDKTLNKFPSIMMHRILFLDWILMHFISWLNFFVSILTYWGSRHVKENEILYNNNPVESSSSEKAQEQFNLSSNEFTESEDKENSVEEALSKSMAGSNDSVNSADKEKTDEDLSQSVITNRNEFAESADKVTLSQSMLMINEPVKSAEESAETQEQSILSKNEESEEKADEEDEDEDEDEMNTIFPGESFQSAQLEYITSSSITSDSFLEDEPFEHVELPSTDEEDENKEKLVSNKAGKDKKVKFPFLAIYSGKNKTVGEKGIIEKGKKKDDKKVIIGKDKKNNDNKMDEDKDKIFELLEAKWHMI